MSPRHQRDAGEGAKWGPRALGTQWGQPPRITTRQPDAPVHNKEYLGLSHLPSPTLPRIWHLQRLARRQEASARLRHPHNSDAACPRILTRREGCRVRGVNTDDSPVDASPLPVPIHAILLQASQTAVMDTKPTEEADERAGSRILMTTFKPFFNLKDGRTICEVHSNIIACRHFGTLKEAGPCTSVLMWRTEWELRFKRYSKWGEQPAAAGKE
ncbi:hypothetical protein B0H13DRAFT_1880193 [Mycena leptocephala]|nr:hypothetical protein B0H13DRAFT_1880193 [Mycena leptocephala]